MENKSHAFMAGLFAILLGLATLLAIYWFGGKKEAMREYVVVTTENVNGLNPQAQVRYRGIRVGKVGEIRLDPDDPRNILIGIRINEAVPVTPRTVAKLAYQGITGLSHVQLEEGDEEMAVPPGPPGEPPRIAMVPSLLQELGDSGSELLEDARELMARAKALLDERNQKKIAAILGNLESVSGELKPTLENVNATLVQVRALLSDDNLRKLSQAAGEAGPLLAETRTLVVKLQAAADKLDAAIGEAPAGGAAALVPRLNELAGDVSSTARQLNRVLKMIEERPQSLVFGVPPPPPGPGEPGFAAPAGSGR